MPNTDEPMNPDEPTVDLSKAAPKTTPVLEQILERINSLAEDFVDFRDEIRQRLSALETATRSLERRFDIYTEDLMRMRGDVKNHEKRLEEVERKAS